MPKSQADSAQVDPGLKQNESSKIASNALGIFKDKLQLPPVQALRASTSEM